MPEQFPPSTLAMLKDSLSKAGIKNPILQSGILAVVSTEGSFYPRNEFSYCGTKAKRLRTLFGSRVADLTDADLETLACNDKLFFNRIYGGEFGKKNLGNTQPGDGYKYLGRGFNGITGRALYNFIGQQIGVDLVNNPELLNKPQVASDALAVYFANGFKVGLKNGYIKKLFGVDDLANITDLPLATKISFQNNAGWKTDLTNPALVAEHKKQLENVEKIYSILFPLNPLTVVTSATDLLTNPKKKSSEKKY